MGFINVLLPRSPDLLCAIGADLIWAVTEQEKNKLIIQKKYALFIYYKFIKGYKIACTAINIFSFIRPVTMFSHH
jgi:hypothetical protein